MRKVAFVTGTCGGIGRACALKLAENGWDIVVAGHTTKPTAQIPTTISDRAMAFSALGVRALPVRCDLADHDSVDSAVLTALEEFGRIDAVINAASALWGENLEQTPLRRFDLMLNVHARGAFAVSARFLPTMREQGSGHLVFVSPPVDLSVVPGHIAESVSKFGMTMVHMGLAEELRGTGISTTAMWPKSRIDCSAPVDFMVANPDVCRCPGIMADAIYEVLQRPRETFGQTLIDEDFLASLGHTDFEQYLCANPQWQTMPSQVPPEARTKCKSGRFLGY
jgi:citronellol/citronellal dehydrogenase